MSVIVFDIDGTLANIDHRRHYVASKPKNWAAFNAGIIHDTPYADMVELSRMFWVKGYKIVLCSGRGSDVRWITIKQMEKFGVCFSELYMRPEKDNRPDYVIKLELLEKIRNDFGEPYLWFDDRTQVVNAIRDAGVRVLQVAPGDF